VTAAAATATRIALSNGGYISSENAAINPGGHASPTISLQLKIPVAAYPAVLQALSAGLGTETALTQQAEDVTEQVADTNSRVTSAQAAIAQLRTLLTRTGSVSDLLTVQDQINSEESTLEQLEAEQRALNDQVSYATVALTLVTPHRKTVTRPAPHRQRGFLAGLSAGWRGLRVTVSAVLIAVGAVLPFAVTIAILAGLVYAARRRLTRLLRRRSRSGAAG
jgi:Flp pilus assembly protein TadB